ncbi:hypothetical protein ACHAPK_011291 [Fusarium culmorum]
MTESHSAGTDRVAEISYFEPLEIHNREKPYISNVPFVETEGPWNNLHQVNHQMPVCDIRGSDNEFLLETKGFEYVKHSFVHQPIDHIDTLSHPYVEEMENFLKDRFGASMVFIAWKPLMKRVSQWPIAVCDTSTISVDDCHAVDTVFPHYASELYHIGHNAAHKWFYLSDQTDEEVLLMQIFDSDTPELPGCPHMSINVGGDNKNKGRRDSAEARAVLIYL